MRAALWLAAGGRRGRAKARAGVPPPPSPWTGVPPLAPQPPTPPPPSLSRRAFAPYLGGRRRVGQSACGAAACCQADYGNEARAAAPPPALQLPLWGEDRWGGSGPPRGRRRRPGRGTRTGPPQVTRWDGPGGQRDAGARRGPAGGFGLVVLVAPKMAPGAGGCLAPGTGWTVRSREWGGGEGGWRGGVCVIRAQSSPFPRRGRGTVRFSPLPAPAGIRRPPRTEGEGAAPTPASSHPAPCVVQSGPRHLTSGRGEAILFPPPALSAPQHTPPPPDPAVPLGRSLPSPRGYTSALPPSAEPAPLLCLPARPARPSPRRRRPSRRAGRCVGRGWLTAGRRGGGGRWRFLGAAWGGSHTGEQWRQGAGPGWRGGGTGQRPPAPADWPRASRPCLPLARVGEGGVAPPPRIGWRWWRQWARRVYKGERVWWGGAAVLSEGSVGLLAPRGVPLSGPVGSGCDVGGVSPGDGVEGWQPFPHHLEVPGWGLCGKLCRGRAGPGRWLWGGSIQGGPAGEGKARVWAGAEAVVVAIATSLLLLPLVTVVVVAAGVWDTTVAGGCWVLQTSLAACWCRVACSLLLCHSCIDAPAGGSLLNCYVGMGKWGPGALSFRAAPPKETFCKRHSKPSMVASCLSTARGRSSEGVLQGSGAQSKKPGLGYWAL